MDLNERRCFLRILGLAGLGSMIHGCGGGGDAGAPTTPGEGTGTPPTPPQLEVTAHVVVVGGGMGGATAAKFLRLWGGTNLRVTLIERNASYTSNILSNLVLNGQRTLSSLVFDYARLKSNHGVDIIQGDVVAIDPVTRRVSLGDGRVVNYDRLILAPGIEFDTMPGLADYGTIAHAWQTGPQTTLLARQITSMPAGGSFVMTIPAAPYRCPPGPYERACVVADYLKRNKPGAKVIVLDANPAIAAERSTFELAFNSVHAGVIEYHPAVTIESIDPANRLTQTNLGSIAASVLNPIPPQRAGRLAREAGLVNVNDRWVGVDVLTYESTAQAGVHVIGDASATTQPKAGHIANAEAKVCVDAILRLLSGQAPDPAPVTSSACYSPITESTASWLTAIYHYDPASRTMKAFATGEAASITAGNHQDMFPWFNNLMADSFG
jgi:sulfide dehydrogenase [flavocytochrome c] flavoprotein chain